jgi:GNAT superfamily N-acetyltransferase
MNFEKAADFIWKNGRLLERRIFKYFFFGGSKSNILNAIKAYQNEDGGFGHAIEPDLRTPESQPLYIEFGLRTLYDAKIQDSELAYKVCEYVSRYADLNMGIATITASSSSFPRAEHWNNQKSEQASFSRLSSLVGLLSWQGIKHPWLDKAVDVCLNDISSTRYEDSHTILNAFCLLESLPQTDEIKMIFTKLSDELLQANFFCLEAPPRTYGLTPLDFSPTSDSYCRRIFSDTTIQDHLKVLESQQEEDGGWQIQWEPPGEMAKLEWRAYKTLKSLITLGSYNKISREQSLISLQTHESPFGKEENNLESRRLRHMDVPAIRALMVDVISRLPSQDFFAMDDEYYLHDHIEEKGEIYGAYLNGDLVAYSVLAFPGLNESNLGREFGVPVQELSYVAILDATVVHESVRGLGLQRYFHELREKRARENGYRYLYSTVHPKNHVSIKNLEAGGFILQFTRLMYGGKSRHCYAKRLL